MVKNNRKSGINCLSEMRKITHNYHRWYNPETGRYIQMERIDKIGHIDYGRGKGINALYMTAQLNNFFVYSYNSPARWVDILGLRPGDVFASIKEAALDAATYIYEVAGPSPEREWGTVKQPFYGMKSVCIQVYTYTEPTEGYSKYGWSPPEYINVKDIMDFHCDALAYLHIHLEGTRYEPSFKDRWATRMVFGRVCRYRYLFSIVVDPEFTVWGINNEGGVFKF